MSKCTCYIKVTNDEFKLIEAIGDSAKELAQACNISENSVLCALSKNSKLYERIEIDVDDKNDYVNQICGNCKYLKTDESGNAGYPCTCSEKTWSKNNIRRKKQKKQAACKYFELKGEK